MSAPWSDADAGDPQPSEQSRWQIVEHVPLPPGRALPAPRTAETADTGDLDDSVDADPNDDERVTTALPGLFDEIFGETKRGAAGQTSRPLFAALDHLLASAEAPLVGDHGSGTGIDRMQRAARQARRSARRSRAIRLLVIALIAVIVLVVLLYVVTRMLHLALVVPVSLP